MVLQDLFDTLASGEFSGLCLGQSVTGSIKEEAYPKVVAALNRGLVEIYKRFILKKKKVYLVQQSGQTRYYLRADYIGYSGATGPQAYLLDHPDEIFLNDVIRILEITDAEGSLIDINPVHPCIEQTYFKLSQFDTLDLVTVETDQVFTIEYQATFPKIEITEEFDPTTLQLHYPPFIEEALINYIASILIRGKATKASEGEGYVSNTWATKYEQACIRLIETGLTEEVYIPDNRFRMKGFI